MHLLQLSESAEKERPDEGDERPEGMLVRQATSVLRCFAAAGASRVGLAHLRAPSILKRSPGVRLPAGAVCFFDRSRAAAKRFC